MPHTDGLEPDRPRGDDCEVQGAALSCFGEPRSLTGHLGVVDLFSGDRGPKWVIGTSGPWTSFLTFG